MWLNDNILHNYHPQNDEIYKYADDNDNITSKIFSTNQKFYWDKLFDISQWFILDN